VQIGQDAAKTTFAGPKHEKTVAERPKRGKTAETGGKRANRDPGTPITYVTVQIGQDVGKTVVARPNGRNGENGQNGGNG
jgi:hypothetical protein